MANNQYMLYVAKHSKKKNILFNIFVIFKSRNR